MSRLEALEQYRAALKKGSKYYSDAVSHGQSPYPPVLEEIYPQLKTASRVELGTLEIPMDAVVGTLAAGRMAAFAGNFMPLLDEDTEFAEKWINLCDAHLNDGGIRDPITCVEYLGRFYVQEGHKRVSVLRSFDAMAIRARVTRVIPEMTDEPALQAYSEFLDFYARTKLYVLRYTRPGCWRALEKGLGFEPGHVWTEEERSEFLAFYWKMQAACTPQILARVREESLSEALLTCLEVYPYEQLKTLDKETLRKRVQALLPDMAYPSAEAVQDSAKVSTEPAIPGKSLVGRILDGITRTTLNVAFIHANDPAQSVWTRGHDEGRRQMEEALGDQVRVRTYVVGEEDADTLMEQAVAKDGAQLMIVTAPTLLGSARQVAALHPGLKVLVCALSVPYVGVRTYYSRIYEAKFIAGAIAGALCGRDPIGYIARYPILGVPAAVNAFAMGARMTNPNARILLDWTCLEGDALQRLWNAGARIISGHPVAATTPSNIGQGWSTALYAENGSFLPLASDYWDWGKTYEQMVRSVLAGAWDSEVPKGTAVSYWWGMSGGVIDIELSEVVPEGVQQLAGILRDGIKAGSIHPFHGTLVDQEGKVRLKRGVMPTPEEIMRMNWLAENVIGRIPVVDELMPMARETTELLALPANKPEPEADEKKPDEEEK